MRQGQRLRGSRRESRGRGLSLGPCNSYSDHPGGQRAERKVGMPLCKHSRRLPSGKGSECQCQCQCRGHAHRQGAETHQVTAAGGRRALTLYALGSIDVLSILRLPIYEHGMRPSWWSGIACSSLTCHTIPALPVKARSYMGPFRIHLVWVSFWGDENMLESDGDGPPAL